MPSADLYVSTSYKIGTITDETFLPTAEFNKEICVGNGLYVNMTITTLGAITLYPRNTISAKITIYIDELYI